MEPLDKARMKVTLNRSRLPTIVVIILMSLVFILAYNYWSLSASNSALRQELRHSENYQLSLERRRRVLESRISEVEAETLSLRGDLVKDRDLKKQATTLNFDLKLELQAARDKLQNALDQERVYREELEKLKAGANGSSSRLKALSTKAEKLLEKFNEVKLNYSALLEKIGTVTNERDNCKESLKALTLELVEAKKSQDEKRSSYKEKPKSKGKSYEGEKADEEESSEVTQKGEEASDQDKGGKKRETGEENVEDEDEGGKEDNVDKDENIEKEEKGGENLDKESQNSTSSSSNSAKVPGEKKSHANQPSSEAREKLEVATVGNSLHSKDKQVADTGGEQQDENQENGEEEEGEKNKDERMDNEQEKDGQDVEDLDLDMKRDTRLRGHPVHPQSEDVLRRQFVDEKQAKSEDEKLQYQGKVSRLQDRGMMRNQDEWADARMEGA